METRCFDLQENDNITCNHRGLMRSVRRAHPRVQRRLPFKDRLPCASYPWLYSAIPAHPPGASAELIISAYRRVGAWLGSEEWHQLKQRLDAAQVRGSTSTLPRAWALSCKSVGVCLSLKYCEAILDGGHLLLVLGHMGLTTLA
ncbi:hypothetical protein NDU88_007777 [Pleurodeles waltl]|uniref:Uncharacterized protein n=1 Tax=Pleurodeles waltl TaxID=8319 RepID=A0AAV7U0M8_PLEWA|nr:hypothetical protein NDU88_007777 [Pleurodeles waltl]